MKSEAVETAAMPIGTIRYGAAGVIASFFMKNVTSF